jgi:beta-N-acetylhexosaminidase
MVRSTLVALLSCCSIAAYSRAAVRPIPKPAGTRTSTSSPLLRSLTLHDRIAQLLVVRGYGDYPPSDQAEYKRFLRWIQIDHVGGFIVAGRIKDGNIIPAQPFEMAVFINRMQHLAKTPLLVGSDFERGASMRVAETAKFPYLMAFGAARDMNAIRQLGSATAHEARALGVNWVFAPDADVNNNPLNPIINMRSFGEDPAAVAEEVSAFIDGAHSDPNTYVLLSAKHFPGHGDTSQDSHMQLATLDQPKERIESIELVPFRAAIQHGVDSIMTAHLAVPSVEPEKIPATLSRKVLTGLLKEELGYKGLVVTDALEMQGVASLFSPGEAAVRAIEAGADVLLMPLDPDASIKAIEAAIASGRLTRKRIDESASKVLAAKQKLGLYRGRFVKLDSITDDLQADELDQLAEHVAEKAITLVKDDKHLLPAPTDDGSCLVLLNEYQFTSRGETLVRAVQHGMPAVKVYVTNSSMPDSVLSAVATDTAAHCKQIYAAAFVTVSANRGSVAMEGGLNAFLNQMVHGPVPVALFSLGNPYLLSSFPDLSTYAAAFSTAASSETAVAKAILGEIAITGKLPVSIPGVAKVGDGIVVPDRHGLASNGSK